MARPPKDGREQDAFKLPRYFRWKPGQRKTAKQAANRRERRQRNQRDRSTLQKGHTA